MDRFSQEDLTAFQSSPEYGLSMVKLTQDIDGAKTAEQKLLAQEAVNQLRKAYTPSGTTMVTSTTTGKDGGGFTYGRQNEYQKLLDSVVNQGSFSYDPGTDPTFGSYKKSYLREGERATQDALAKASVATGGVPSSYAVSAAQQAGNYYAGKLNDMIPTLQQNAYQKYLNDFSSKLSALGAMDTDRNFEWNKYLQDYENALRMYNMLGYATPEIAAILGIEATQPSSGGGYYYGGNPKPEKEEEDPRVFEPQTVIKTGGGSNPALIKTKLQVH